MGTATAVSHFGRPPAEIVVPQLSRSRVLAVWAAFAFSGAGLLPRLPLLQAGLVAISAVYLLRAMAPVAILLFRPALMSPFVWWSSAIVLVYGLAYGIGTYAAWPRLSGTGQAL